MPRILVFALLVLGIVIVTPVSALLQDVVVGGFSQVPGAHVKQAAGTVVTTTTVNDVSVALSQ